MSKVDLRRYLQQMLVQLAELAEVHAEDEALRDLACDLRRLAERSDTGVSPPPASYAGVMH